MLARAMKDHERRIGGDLGFSDAPGDCLAFKYYRDVRTPDWVHIQSFGQPACVLP